MFYNRNNNLILIKNVALGNNLANTISVVSFHDILKIKKIVKLFLDTKVKVKKFNQSKLKTSIVDLRNFLKK